MIEKALIALCPGCGFTILDDEYDNIWWNPDNTLPLPSKEVVDAKIVELRAQVPVDACKVEAKKRIAATDWAVLPDVGLANKSEFEAYRAQLRALITNPVANPTWPTEPEPIWS